MKLGAVSSYLFWFALAVILTQFPVRVAKDASTGNHRAGISRVAGIRAAAGYGRLPLSFEANQGQADSGVRFLVRGNDYSLALTSTEAMLSWRSRDSRSSSLPKKEETAVRMKLAGANPLSQMAGMDELPGKINYFIGNDPASWRTNIPTYAKVRSQDVYPGVDVIYYGNQRQLEYDFIVAPAADPGAIALSFDGTAEFRIDSRGDLVLQEGGSELRLHRPVVYQEIGGERQTIDGGFVLKGTRQVGFHVEGYDASKPLVIDPVFSYSTYLGGAGDDQSNAIAVDSSGNVYLTGSTSGGGFPAAKPIQATYGGGQTDVFVTKLNAAGSAIVYSTFLGGKGSDAGRGITVDSSGSAYVTGLTDSSNFPTSNALQATFGGTKDAFVAKLNPTGSALIYSTYLGGSGNDLGGSVAVDSSGNAYVTGATNSPNFPTAKPLQAALAGASDCFIAKINPAGSALIYSTYLGGGSTDEGTGIVVDSSGNAYVTGNASSENFPTVNPFQATNHSRNKSDAFVAKLNAAGSALIYSTYYGGTRGEYGQGIAIDSAGDAYITGYTDANTKDLPRANAAQQEGGGQYDAFVAKFNAAGSALVYSTYLGGKGDEYGAAIAVDSAGNAYVTGSTTSNNFPTLNAFQAAGGGGTSDAFLTIYNPAGAVLASSYFGGNNDDYGSGIAVDSSGNVYVTGYTSSTNFPTAKPFQAAYGGGSNDVFATKFPAVAGNAAQ